MTFTIPELQMSFVVYTLIAVMVFSCTLTCMSEYQRYKFFKRAKSLKDLEEWKVSNELEKK